MKTFYKYTFVHVLLFLIVTIFSLDKWPYSLLTVAQLIYIPTALHFIFKDEAWFRKWYFFFAIPVYISIALLQITDQTPLDWLLATIYLLFTFCVAIYGVVRFLRIGFTQLEEFSINLGLIYLVMGGIWFFAFELNIETGFPPLITWLTSIHFHYSAFLLPVFTGFLGRIYKPISYHYICTIILISPIIVALGITFSHWVELFSVVLYIAGIYGFIYLSMKAPISSLKQKWMICISFCSLGVTIFFSFLYAIGNALGLIIVDIDFMLLFHGFLNCIVFALVGIIGWSISIPEPKKRTNLPISNIRGRCIIGEKIIENIVNRKHPVQGLVDSMNSYEPQVNVSTLAPTIKDFYENTKNYKLYAQVKWHWWFIPLAFMYRLISQRVQQINLPITKKKVEMTGDILSIKRELDGRKAPRAWVRKIKDKVIFVALYSEHVSKDRTYMNIALPLPASTMVGILKLEQNEHHLILSSKSKEDDEAGIYLAIGKMLPKLPIAEEFYLEEVDNGKLIATHDMWIFGIPFLTINYDIMKKTFANNDGINERTVMN